MKSTEEQQVELLEELAEDIQRESVVSGEPQRGVFFNIFSVLATENGDCNELQYLPAHREGARPFQIDGLFFDRDLGEVHLAICDYYPGKKIERLNKSHIEAAFKKAERFFSLSMSQDFVSGLEESSTCFEAAWTIFQNRHRIGRVRIILFSNRVIATRSDGLISGEIGSVPVSYNVFDLSRYVDVYLSGQKSEPIEVNFRQICGEPLTCVTADFSTFGYASYLAVLPAEVLAKIYGLYGARLLEQNVRTFLQAKTKVNKGIIKTLEEEPGMFFAYNNGLTVTAQEVTVSMDGDGSIAKIESIKNMQIVNGGQTTASILYAKDVKGAELSMASVQMKLSVVGEGDLAEIVPNISRYANRQNKISEADLFSNHPFHIEMENISRRLSIPQRAGQLTTSKWFYERARGQYRDQAAYLTKAQRRKFEAEFPKDQRLTKTDLAKFEMSAAMKPHEVSKGAQKCFLAFAKIIDKEWEKNSDTFGDYFFKRAIAKAILFKAVDRIVSLSEWYQSDRGYKANIATYTVAYIVHHVTSRDQGIDWDRIWRSQELPRELIESITRVAPRVAEAIKTPPPEIRNIGEYAKQQACWARIASLNIELGATESYSVSREESSIAKKEGVQEKKLDNEIAFDKRLLEVQPSSREIERRAEKKGWLSPKSSQALKKLQRGDINLNRGEKNAMKYLLERLDDEESI